VENNTIWELLILRKFAANNDVHKFS